VKPGAYFLYFDPLRTLADDQKARWQIPAERAQMVAEALDGARAARSQ
jgi:hypothetical protein